MIAFSDGCNVNSAIRVKIVRTWKTPIGSIRPSTCLVIGDEKVRIVYFCESVFFFIYYPDISFHLLQQGTTIDATIPWEVKFLFGINLDEGDWFEIYGF
ncbi:hypothetical protein YC2023_053953 [Brassica napus]